MQRINKIRNGARKIQINQQPHVNESVRDYVYNTLKKKIIEWELEPKAKISESEVAAQLNVSRTPVREAFLMLKQEELISVYPQKGTTVADIDLEIVEEGRFVREKIERAIVREACEKFGEEQFFQLETNVTMQELCLKKGSHHRLFQLDEEFHRLLFEGCNKLRTWNLINQMNSHFARLRVLRLASNPDWSVVVNQHKELVKYILNKEEDLAEKLTTEHLNLVNYEKEELKVNYPNYFK